MTIVRSIVQWRISIIALLIRIGTSFNKPDNHFFVTIICCIMVNSQKEPLMKTA